MNLQILRLIAGRLAVGVVSLLIVSAIVFAITGLLPGDAAQEQLGQEATPEALAALRQQMGLTQSGPERYWQWLNGLLRGNPGQSIVSSAPVVDLIGSGPECVGFGQARGSSRLTVT